jgi:hypothetical protein
MYVLKNEIMLIILVTMMIKEKGKKEKKGWE